MPLILTRKDWGAQPAKKFPGFMREPVPETWVHHTVTPTYLNDPAAGMREIQKIAFSRGFLDFSYSFAIFINGVIGEGRGWGVVGAHTEGHNSSSLGFVLVGNYENVEPTTEQIYSIKYLIRWGIENGKIKPGTQPTGGHRDTKSTACPGRFAYAKIPEIRNYSAPVTNVPTYHPTQPALFCPVRANDVLTPEKYPEFFFLRGYIKCSPKIYLGHPLSDFQVIPWPVEAGRPQAIPTPSIFVGFKYSEGDAHIGGDEGDTRCSTLKKFLGFSEM